MMKVGVIIVNTARGPIINEEALVAALKSGKVWSCGLDVFEHEPSIHPDLIAHPRSLLLPHLGTYTIEVGATYMSSMNFLLNRHQTHTLMERRCISNVRSALTTGRLEDPVHE